MTGAELMTLIGSIGFPSALLIFVMIRYDKLVDKLTALIANNTQAMQANVDQSKATCEKLAEHDSHTAGAVPVIGGIAAGVARIEVNQGKIMEKIDRVHDRVVKGS